MATVSDMPSDNSGPSGNFDGGDFRFEDIFLQAQTNRTNDVVLVSGRTISNEVRRGAIFEQRARNKIHGADRVSSSFAKVYINDGDYSPANCSQIERKM